MHLNVFVIARKRKFEIEFSLITFHISCVLSFVRQKRHFDKYEVELEHQRDFKNLCITPLNF